MQVRLLTGEHIEVVMFSGRAHSVALGQARLRFNGYGKPWLPDPDRAVSVPVLNLDLAFDQKHPDRNRLLKAHRTGEFLLCDVRVEPVTQTYGILQTEVCVLDGV
jgi:hypothetical protein